MKAFKDHLKEACDCWKGYKRVPGTKPCAPGSCVKEDTVSEGKEDKIAQLKKDHETAVHWSKNETSPQKREAARQKAEKIKRHLGTQYKQGVAEGAPIVVALPPIDVRNPKKAAQPQRYMGDIVPPTQPASTEKRGVKGRPGQRPMPTYEELSSDDMFDIIEELVTDLAEEHSIDPEVVWEKLESIDDDTLFEAAIDAKGHKSSTGGLTQKGVDAYNAKTGGNLKMAVTTPPSKLKAGSKAANRRKSFCARMSGVDGPMKDEKGRPTRKALALRKWNC